MAELPKERSELERAAHAPLEPERYELTEGSRYHFAVERRDFFKFMGSGVAVLMTMRGAALAQAEAGGSAPRIPQEISAWLHIGEDDVVTVFSGKVELGQNARTMLTQLVADELHVPLEKIDLVLGDTSRTPWDRGTLGSETTPVMGMQLRRASSAAREIIVARAAELWKVDPKLLETEQGRVMDPTSGRSTSYSELVKGQELARVIPAGDPPARPSEWTIAGSSVPKIGGRTFVTGTHRYTIDVKREGMLHGCMVRPASYGATLDTVDASGAQAMPGVTVVRDGDFLGVVGPSRAVAERAAAAIKTTWKATPQPSNAEIFDYLKSHAKPVKAGATNERPGWNNYYIGSMDQGLGAAEHNLEQTYTVRYIAHCPLATRAAVAEWDGDELTVWTGTQRPHPVRSDLARALRIPETNVRVVASENDPCYGGKHTGDPALEAARLACKVKKPVKLIWNREEEFTWAYFRPAGVIEVHSGIAADGKITAWEFHNYNSGNAGIETPYQSPNQLIQFHPSDSPLRQGSYRGLAATANHFARETHMDELAQMAKLDPLEFRRMNLDDPRLLAVFEAATNRFGWRAAKKADGQGFGLGGGTEKGSYIATCAEVRVDRASGAVRVMRVVSAFECGAIVNPEHLQNQVEGAVMMGLGGALFEQIDFDSGRIRNPHFAQYRLPRFSDMPQIEAVLLDRRDIEPAGAGETPMFGLAPAIGNAIFDATGIRLRALPLAPNGLNLRKA
jgi:isoquinoline 1-oxidoreductase